MHGLGLFVDEMVNTFDPDAFIVGGGALEASKEFQGWFLEQIRAASPPRARSRPAFQSTWCRMGTPPEREEQPSKR